MSPLRSSLTAFSQTYSKDTERCQVVPAGWTGVGVTGPAAEVTSLASSDRLLAQCPTNHNSLHRSPTSNTCGDGVAVRCRPRGQQPRRTSRLAVEQE